MKWPTLVDLCKTDLDLLNVPILSMVKTIASLTACVRVCNYYITSFTLYNELAKYAEQSHIVLYIMCGALGVV